MMRVLLWVGLMQKIFFTPVAKNSETRATGQSYDKQFDEQLEEFLLNFHLSGVVNLIF
jgi:hypothetical protein